MTRYLSADQLTIASGAQINAAVLYKSTGYLGGDILRWSGFGELTIGTDVYLGSGDLISVSDIGEGTDIMARGAKIEISGANQDRLSEALDEDYKGRDVELSMAIFDENHALIGDPVIFFRGRIDTMTIEDSETEAKITVTVESQLSTMLRAVSRRYTSSDQQRYYPNDLGFEYLERTDNVEIVWR